MKRPYLYNVSIVQTTEQISLKACCHLRREQTEGFFDKELDQLEGSSPVESLNLLRGHKFQFRIVIMNQLRQKIYEKIYDSDRFGNLNASINQLRLNNDEPSYIEIFEISFCPGLHLNLGAFIPLKIENPKKVIISDFDKTLVDTRYSTTKELFYSIVKPVDYFPTIEKSVELLKSYVQKGFQPFILSASPHFYENAIRDWLYQKEIYSAGVFLKDYRKVFSFIEGDLYPKDIKSQGFYKLNQLVDILLMTGIPKELVLMGDGFESDSFIYLLLEKLLVEKEEPWSLWRKVRQEDAFKLRSKQNSTFLNKLYQLANLIQAQDPEVGETQVKIYIRYREEAPIIHLPLAELNERKELINFFQA
jgi:hypothetical protein